MPRDVVTGAFSYTGRYIAERLLASGRNVTTLSRHAPHAAHPLADRVAVERLQFDDVTALVASLRGAETLYNTYWIRFPHRGTTFEQAVANTRMLFHAAEEAGVRKVVHLSVTNPSPDSPFAYFRGKAAVETALGELSVDTAIVRPTLVFGGREEVLINNMAWLLRHLPLYALPGSAGCRVQPVSVEDVADLVVRAGNRAGPEIYAFADFVALLRDTLAVRTRLVHVPGWLLPPLAWMIGATLGDVLLTREELGALRGELLVSHQPPTGHRRFSEWLPGQTEWLGRSYANELGRNWASAVTSASGRHRTPPPPA